MLVVVEFLARSGGLQTALRAAIFAANVVAEVVDLGPRSTTAATDFPPIPLSPPVSFSWRETRPEAG
jgi:hypothetical protein